MSARMRSNGIAYAAFSLGGVLAAIPGLTFLGGLSSLIAFVFSFIVLFGLAREYGDDLLKSLARRYVYVVIAMAVLLVIFAVLLGPDIAGAAEKGMVDRSVVMNIVYANLSKYLILFLLIAAALIYNGYIFFKYWKVVSEKTGVSLFRTAGILFLIAPILTVTVVLSFLAPIVGLVGQVLLLIAFINVQPEQPQASEA